MLNVISVKVDGRKAILNGKGLHLDSNEHSGLRYRCTRTSTCKSHLYIKDKNNLSVKSISHHHNHREIE